MNLRDTRKQVKERIDTMTDDRLDALLTLLKNQLDDLLVREDDESLVNYGKIASEINTNPLSSADFALRMKLSLKKRKEARKLVDELSKKHLEAIATMLEEADDGYIISEEEWAEIDQRVKDVEEGRVKMIPMEEALARVKENLRKLRE